MNTTGFSAKNKNNIVYCSLGSAIRPVLHNDSLAVPVPPHDGVASVEGEEEHGQGASG